MRSDSVCRLCPRVTVSRPTGSAAFARCQSLILSPGPLPPSPPRHHRSLAPRPSLGPYPLPFAPPPRRRPPPFTQPVLPLPAHPRRSPALLASPALQRAPPCGAPPSSRAVALSVLPYSSARLPAPSPSPFPRPPPPAQQPCPLTPRSPARSRASQHSPCAAAPSAHPSRQPCPPPVPPALLGSFLRPAPVCPAGPLRTVTPACLSLTSSSAAPFSMNPDSPIPDFAAGLVQRKKSPHRRAPGTAAPAPVVNSVPVCTPPSASVLTTFCFSRQ